MTTPFQWLMYAIFSELTRAGDPPGSLGARSGHPSTDRKPHDGSPLSATQSPDIYVKAAQAEARKVALPKACRKALVTDVAVVTLVSSSVGYPAGALALSASLEVLGSELRRIALVTPAVDGGVHELLRTAAWEVRLVNEIACHQMLGRRVSAERYDLGAAYAAKTAKWLSTCTKFHSWGLLELRKVIFLDADTLALRPIDSLAEHPSAFAAAPDTFPADQFNSGVMVLAPSRLTFEALLKWNAVNGTAEGGDQCLLNEFFAEWYYSAWDAEATGRLPWIFNVGAAHLSTYQTLARMQDRDEPSIAHFVGGESKPWAFMMLKLEGMADRVPENARRYCETTACAKAVAQKPSACLLSSRFF